MRILRILFALGTRLPALSLLGFTMRHELAALLPASCVLGSIFALDYGFWLFPPSLPARGATSSPGWQFKSNQLGGSASSSISASVTLGRGGRAFRSVLALCFVATDGPTAGEPRDLDQPTAVEPSEWREAGGALCSGFQSSLRGRCALL